MRRGRAGRACREGGGPRASGAAAAGAAVTTSIRDDALRDGTPTLIALRTLPGQRLPFCVTTMRPLSVVACEALAAADAQRVVARARRALEVAARKVGEE